MTIKLTGTVRSKTDTLTPDYEALAAGISVAVQEKRECSISVQIDHHPSGLVLSHVTLPVTPGQLAEISVGSTVTIEVQTR